MSRAKEFLEELIRLYEKYDVSISHQDYHGAFIIMDNDKENVDWIKDAEISITDRELENE